MKNPPATRFFIVTENVALNADMRCEISPSFFIVPDLQFPKTGV